MRSLFSVLAVVTAVVVLSQCGGEQPSSETGTDSSNGNETAVSGESVYARQCALCHGSNGDLGASGASPLSLSKLNEQQRIEVITDGRGKMMPYSGLLTEEEIKAVAAYIETLKKK